MGPLAGLFQAGLGIRSLAHRSFTHLLILLKSNELLWAIRSFVMCDREWFAQVAHDKWAIGSKIVGKKNLKSYF